MPSLPYSPGKLGKSKPLSLAERALEAVPAKSPACISVDATGRVWVSRIDASGADTIATITRGSDPDWLADELAYAAESMRQEQGA